MDSEPTTLSGKPTNTKDLSVDNDTNTWNWDGDSSDTVQGKYCSKNEYPLTPALLDHNIPDCDDMMDKCVTDSSLTSLDDGSPEKIKVEDLLQVDNDSAVLQNPDKGELQRGENVVKLENNLNNTILHETSSTIDVLSSEKSENNILTNNLSSSSSKLNEQSKSDLCLEKRVTKNIPCDTEKLLSVAIIPTEIVCSDTGVTEGVKLVYGDEMWPVGRVDVEQECTLSSEDALSETCQNDYEDRVATEAQAVQNEDRNIQSEKREKPKAKCQVRDEPNLKNDAKTSSSLQTETPEKYGIPAVPREVDNSSKHSEDASRNNDTTPEAPQEPKAELQNPQRNVPDSSAVPSDTAPLPVPVTTHQTKPASLTIHNSDTATVPLPITPVANTGLEKGPMADLNGHAISTISKSFTDLPASVQQTLQNKEELQKLRRESHVLRQELQQCKETIQKLQQREKVLKERLSEQAQKQMKVSSKFEDLSLGEKRPTQLIRHYGNLYSEARLDAYDALDDLPEIKDFDDLKGKLLFSVIVLAFRSVTQSLSKLQTQLKHLLCLPEEEEEISHHTPSQELQDAITAYLMKTVDTYDMSSNIEEVSGQVFSTLFDYPSLKNCSGLKQYIEDCVRIAWALSVQRPTYVIKYDSPIFVDNIHTRFHASDADSNIIKMVMWPSLLEGLDGPCVFKGVVLT